MKKRYIADVIEEKDFCTWLAGKKVILNAPTGTGKTTFILTKLLPFCKIKGKKMLILCNRRLLREQYDFDLAQQYRRFSEMAADVAVSTYQQMAQKICSGEGLTEFLKEFDVIVCDEVHYFYSDSDFNASGTYILLQALILGAFYRSMIFITATLEEVLPLLENTLKKCAEKIRKEAGIFPGFEKYVYAGQIYDFSYWVDYERFECKYAVDVQTLAERLARSEKKSLVFIDDKSRAENFKKLILKAGDMAESQIYILNAQVLEERKKDLVIQSLVMCHKIVPKILITTSVLDNGVSIHDTDVGNVVIATEAKVSFHQMLGRVRAESSDKCTLYVYPRDASYYETRIQQYEKRLAEFERLKKINEFNDEFRWLAEGWFGTGEDSECYRNMLVLTKREVEFYTQEKKNIFLQRGELLIAINEFAKEKAGNMLLAEKLFWQMAIESPEKVAEEQIAWIGKSKDELEVIESEYMIQQEELLRKMLLEIQNYTYEEFQKVKKEISERFRKNILVDIPMKGESFSKDKLKQICSRVGLILETEIGTDKKQRYTIKPRA